MTSKRPRMTAEAFRERAAAAYDALSRQTKAVAASGLDAGLIELVKIRASQLNGCAFCLQYHLNLARRAGVEHRKLDLLPVWREAEVHSPAEVAALRLAEALTALHDEAALDAAYMLAADHFDAEALMFLTVSIGQINQWNRIAVGLRFPTPPTAV